MSTNFKNQEENAQKDLGLKKVVILRRAKKKRVTKQVRIIVVLHQKIKEISRNSKKTIAKTLEEICSFYFQNTQ